ncbi:hypothetical protein [Achromobacter ruhlandii]|uniref:Uncharacterized protein n=1 Tax=Achromobacter ruhlandii TaxID=72557 RepID=A0A2M9H0T5_9BURK|nr:hypothetical protein [Achromobacter ruhlandii]PJM70416.1 hypothetical protein CV751_09295 [Achromobacter ruhlandii]CAB3834122.1 hypothetical protein LMG3328_00914 [Achromobacter ruhlandii]
MSDILRIEHVPLTAADMALLRRCSRGKTLAAIAGLVMFLLLVATVLVIALLAWSEWRSLGGGDGVMVLLVGIGAGVGAIFFGRRLLRLPRAWGSVGRALKGRAPKQIVSGHLTGFGPGQRPGLSYVFGGQRVDVAVPFWNEVTSDTRSGARPVGAVALTDLPVRLHVLPLQPDAPGLLLGVDYPMSGQAVTSLEAISDADRDQVRGEELAVRKFFLWSALAMLAVSLFVPPLILLAALLALMGWVLGMRSPRLKRARYKHGVRGVVEEVVTYRLHMPNSPTVSLAHNYRVGGVMYRIDHLGPVATPGQRVEFEYVDAGPLGQRGLFFRIEDQPAMTL